MFFCLSNDTFHVHSRGGSLVATPFWLLYFPFHSLRVLIILYMLSPLFSTRTHLPHITLASKYVIASCLLLHLLSCLNTPFLFKHRFCYLNNICHSGGKAYFLSRYCKKFLVVIFKRKGQSCYFYHCKFYTRKGIFMGMIFNI